MKQRDEKGHFLPNNEIGKQGGRPKSYRHMRAIEALRIKIEKTLGDNWEKFEKELPNLEGEDFIESMFKLLKLYMPTVRAIDYVEIEGIPGDEENNPEGKTRMVPVSWLQQKAENE